ncbi:MAG: AEC family transporter, partial [Actinomycetes bacterium]
TTEQRGHRVQGVLEGFATIGTIIALGYLLAHIQILDVASQVMLSRLAFFVASPALLVTVLGGTDVTDVLSGNLAASAVGVAVAALLYVAVARLVWRRDLGDTVIGTLSASYVNAGNLGLPIAAYVLGDAALIAPVLLLQLLVMQPLALAMLDSAVAGARVSVGSVLTKPFRNPLTVGSIIGVILSVTSTELPRAIEDPLVLVGGMAVPAMLLAYGVSLKLGPRPGAGASTLEIGYISFLKLVVQPAAAYLVARFVLGVGDLALLAVTVTAALPTAQNIFVHATRYDRATILARDAIFVTTLLSVPTLFVIAALLA